MHLCAVTLVALGCNDLGYSVGCSLCSDLVCTCLLLPCLHLCARALVALVFAMTSVTVLAAVLGGVLFALACSVTACACVHWPGGPGLHWCALDWAALVSALVSAETCLALVCNDLGGTCYFGAYEALLMELCSWAWRFITVQNSLRQCSNHVLLR